MQAERARSMRILDAIESAPRHIKPFLVAADILVIAAIGFVDYLSGYEMASSLFYLLPIAFITWSAGRMTGMAVSVLAAAVWMAADAAAGHVYSRPIILYWNAALRLGFFLAVTLLLAALQESLRHERQLARLDSLTGAINGRHFLEIMQREIDRSNRYKRPFTLVYLDIDDFKQVNDGFGHNSGDTILRTVVAVARTHLRTTDTIARLGGDEFAVLLPETDPEEARAAVTKMRVTLLERMRREGWPVTFSMGTLSCRGAAPEPDTLLRLTDELMYRVKRAGKDGVSFDVVDNG